MRVLMQSRVDLSEKPGGDTVQLKKTKEALEKLGVLKKKQFAGIARWVQ